MGQLQQRIIAGSGAILFLVTSMALTVVVIVTMVQDSKKPKTDQTAAADTCQSSQAEEVLEVPEVYKPEAAVTELQTTDLTEGTGPVAKNGDCLVMKYYGTLAATGAKFDENFTQPTGFAFQLGQGRVIEGWDKGLVGMKEGGVRRLVIPASLAYRDQSPSEAIPANSDLVFVVKLLRIQK